jgi:ribonuclease VapC
MIVDASALIAIIKEEVDAPVLGEALRRSELRPKIAAPTLLEASLVADGLSLRGGRRLDSLARAAHLEVISFDAEMAQVARAAYREYGRGSGHPAGLNFGDCFSYALAAVTGEPLLYKGDDFVHTDIRSALEA